MFMSTRLQLLFSAYGVLLCVSFKELVRDLLITHNFFESWLHAYTNPINWCMFPFALIIGYLLAKELEV